MSHQLTPIYSAIKELRAARRAAPAVVDCTTTEARQRFVRAMVDHLTEAIDRLTDYGMDSVTGGVTDPPDVEFDTTAVVFAPDPQLEEAVDAAS